MINYNKIKININEKLFTNDELKIFKAIESYDKETAWHCVDVAEHSLQLAKYLGLSEQEQIDVYKRACLHDFGKTLIPKTILQKPGRLTKFEETVIRIHDDKRAIQEGLKNIGIDENKLDSKIFEAMYSHHKNEGDIQNRIIHLVDIFGAIHMERPYKNMKSDGISVDIMVNDSKLDKQLAQDFKKSFGKEISYDLPKDYIPSTNEYFKDKSLTYLANKYKIDKETLNIIEKKDNNKTSLLVELKDSNASTIIAKLRDDYTIELEKEDASKLTLDNICFKNKNVFKFINLKEFKENYQEIIDNSSIEEVNDIFERN